MVGDGEVNRIVAVYRRRQVGGDCADVGDGLNTSAAASRDRSRAASQSQRVAENALCRFMSASCSQPESGPPRRAVAGAGIASLNRIVIGVIDSCHPPATARLPRSAWRLGRPRSGGFVARLRHFPAQGQLELLRLAPSGLSAATLLAFALSGGGWLDRLRRWFGNFTLGGVPLRSLRGLSVGLFTSYLALGRGRVYSAGG